LSDSRDIAIQFGRNLRRLRRRADISQEGLAYRASLHRTEIGLLERGERIPQLDTILKVAGGLEAEPCELIEGMSWEPGHVTTGNFELPGTSA
jgi:transcriptional regulator with XRE-family HTH domain